MFKRKSRTDRAARAADQALQAGRPYVEKAKPYVDKAKPYVDRLGKVAQERGGPLVEQARDFAEDAAHDLGPHLDRAREVLKDDVAPKVSSAVSEALTASAPYREEAARRGSAALAALKGDVEVAKPKRKWGRKLLIASGIAGLVVVAYKYLTGESSTSGWQTPSPTPPPPPTPPPGSTGPATADRAYTSDPGTGATDAAEAGAQAEAAGDQTTAQAKAAEAADAETASTDEADGGETSDSGTDENKPA